MADEKTLPKVCFEDLLDLLEYVQHDSWRCQRYQKCHCGLDALTDKMGLDRIPVPGNPPVL